MICDVFPTKLLSLFDYHLATRCWLNGYRYQVHGHLNDSGNVGGVHWEGLWLHVERHFGPQPFIQPLLVIPNQHD